MLFSGSRVGFRVALLTPVRVKVAELVRAIFVIAKFVTDPEMERLQSSCLVRLYFCYSAEFARRP